LMGIEKFYIYNNNSTDNTSEIINEYQSKNEAVHIQWTFSEKNRQLSAYQNCLDRFKNETKWIAFIDTDEFLFSPTGKKLPEILPEYEQHAGIGVNWVCFGSSGHMFRQNGLVMGNYRWRASDGFEKNEVIKSIVNTSKIKSVGPDAHIFYYQNDESTVDENHESNIHNVHRQKFTTNKFRINHYILKSMEDYIAKVRKGAMMDIKKYDDPKKYFDYYNRFDVYDDAILQHAVKLKYLTGESLFVPIK